MQSTHRFLLVCYRASERHPGKPWNKEIHKRVTWGVIYTCRMWKGRGEPNLSKIIIGQACTDSNHYSYTTANTSHVRREEESFESTHLILGELLPRGFFLKINSYLHLWQCTFNRESLTSFWEVNKGNFLHFKRVSRTSLRKTPSGTFIFSGPHGLLTFSSSSPANTQLLQWVHSKLQH